MNRKQFIVSFLGVITGIVAPWLILPKKSKLIVPPVKPKILLPPQFGIETVKDELQKFFDSRKCDPKYNWVVYTENPVVVQQFLDETKRQYGLLAQR